MGLGIITAAYIATAAGALIVLKLGSADGPFAQFVEGKIVFNLTAYTVIGVIMYGISFLLYMYLISKFDLGYIIPLTTALVYILIFIASFVLFKETFTAGKVAGILLILLGVVLLNLRTN